MEMEELRHRRDQSLFRREFNLIGSRLVQTGKAWFKSQGIILLLTCGLSIGAMIWMGNPYAVLAGTAIALLDALPLLGAGAVLLPWAFFVRAGRTVEGCFDPFGSLSGLLLCAPVSGSEVYGQ